MAAAATSEPSLMRVIDGAHRVRAAALRGRQTIEARLIDGPEGELFVLAVQANSSHGLPLSLVDRKAVILANPHASLREMAGTRHAARDRHHGLE